MATLSISAQAPMSAPWRTGIAFAVTVAVFYALCTLVWLAAPGPFLGFMNNLFHGVDFGPLLKPAAFSWGGFLGALAVMSAWSLLAGTFFGWLRGHLGA